MYTVFRLYIGIASANLTIIRTSRQEKKIMFHSIELNKKIRYGRSHDLTYCMKSGQFCCRTFILFICQSISSSYCWLGYLFKCHFKTFCESHSCIWNVHKEILRFPFVYVICRLVLNNFFSKECTKKKLHRVSLIWLSYNTHTSTLRNDKYYLCSTQDTQNWMTIAKVW